MKKEKYLDKKIIAVISAFIIVITGFSGCIKDEKHVTHLQVMTGVLEKDSVKVFYKISSQTQKNIASQALEIIHDEYETCSEILNLSIDNLNPCSMVFCESYSDRYIKVCNWFAYVDGVQCWPIIGEKSMDFKGDINHYLLYHMLPHEIADTTLRVREVDYIYGAWFIEGVGEYARLMCAKDCDELNDAYWINKIPLQLEIFSKQEDRVVNLSDRSSFAGYGFPGSEDEQVFYVGSLTYIYDLVEKYGDNFISDVVNNNCKSYEEIRSTIEDSTGYDINNSIMNLSVGWIKQKYISILDELNIDYN